MGSTGPSPVIRPRTGGIVDVGPGDGTWSPPRRRAGARLLAGEARRAVLVPRPDRHLEAGTRRRIGLAGAPPDQHRRTGLSGKQQSEEPAAVPAIRLRRDWRDHTSRTRPHPLDDAPPIAAARAGLPYRRQHPRTQQRELRRSNTSRLPTAAHSLLRHHPTTEGTSPDPRHGSAPFLSAACGVTGRREWPHDRTV